jgi:hypothetical protein
VGHLQSALFVSLTSADTKVVKLAGAFAITLIVVSGCLKRETKLTTLKSGSTIELSFSGTLRNAFFIEYCTRHSLSDRSALGREADEVIEYFRSDIERSKMPEASLWPTDCHWRVSWSGWMPVVIGQESTSLDYSRGEGGIWSRRH